MPTKKHQPKIIYPIVAGIIGMLWIGFYRLVVPGRFSPGQAFNLALISRENDVWLLTYQGSDQNGAVIHLDGQMAVETARNLGEYPLAKVFILGEQQQIGGGRLVTETLRDGFGFPVDGFLYFSGIDSDRDLLPLEAIFRHSWWRSESNLAVSDRMEWWWLVVSGRLKRWERIDLSVDNPDNMVYYLADPEIVRRDLTVGIINQSNCQQAAQKTSRMMVNLGLQAVHVDSEETTSPVSVLYHRSAALLPRSVVQRIARVSQVGETATKEFAQPTDLLLVIGQDRCQLPSD